MGGTYQGGSGSLEYHFWKRNPVKLAKKNEKEQEYERDVTEKETAYY